MKAKKVLIVCGSPRRNGNTSILCDEFMKGAVEARHDVEKILLADKKVNLCTGCGTCVRTKKCAQKDDMAALLEKMLAADVIVLATPVYFYSMSAQLKVFIDRCAPRYEEMRGKEFYFVLAAADSKRANMKRVVEALRGFTFCLEDPREKGIVYGLGAWEPGDVRSGPAMREAYEMGRNL